jgi:Ser/Thr protein kinase RdoA (MazF antagonist)
MKLSHLFGGERRLSGFVDRFTANHLSGVLESIGHAPAAKIESFASGQNALVRRLILANGKSLVLRAYFADAKKQPGFSHWYLNRHLAERGFRVPEIHLRRAFSFPQGKADVEVLVEDFIEGQVVTEAVRDDEAVRRGVVEILLRLHDDQSPRPGRPWLGIEARDPLQEAMARAPVRFERLRTQLTDVTPRQVERCLAWFRERLAQRQLPPSYELIHGDFNRENLLITPDGGIVLIDLVSMGYGCFESDLVDTRWMFFDQAWWDGFCDEYFAAQPSRRDRFERNAPLFFAFFYLMKSSRQASSAGKAIEKRDHEAVESHLAKSRRFWNLLLAAIEA